MSWFWVPIADGDPAEERQFTDKDFLDQIIDTLNLCIPLWDWYQKTGDPADPTLDDLGPYTEGVTDAGSIWQPIQERIETLVGSFIDYAAITNGDWFYGLYLGSLNYPTKWGMANNVFERFKDHARAVSGIPTAHRMKKEDVAATGISHTIAYDSGTKMSKYTFPSDIEGFKWNSITIPGFTQTYAIVAYADGDPGDGYFFVYSTSESSGYTSIYFSEENDGETVTINYNVDESGFGWQRRIDDPANPGGFIYADGQAEAGDVIHACLLNQIYACTVILQKFAVMVGIGHPDVAGTPGDSPSPGVHTGGGLISYMGPISYSGFGVTPQEACNTAKDAQESGWPAPPTWDDGTYSRSEAQSIRLSGFLGADSHAWSGSRQKYSLNLTNVPIATDYNVKDFVEATAIQNSPRLSDPAQNFYGWGIAGGTGPDQVWDLVAYNTGNAANFSSVVHGDDTGNPVEEAGPGCPVSSSTETWGNISNGWISIQLTIPDPTSPPP